MANQSLSLLQSQRQIQMLAPQLRQSLELLQLPALELRAAIQKELQQNPTLEEKPPETADIAIEPAAGAVDDAGEMSFRKSLMSFPAWTTNGANISCRNRNTVYQIRITTKNRSF